MAPEFRKNEFFCFWFLQSSFYTKAPGVLRTRLLKSILHGHLSASRRPASLPHHVPDIFPTQPQSTSPQPHTQHPPHTNHDRGHASDHRGRPPRHRQPEGRAAREPEPHRGQVSPDPRNGDARGLRRAQRAGRELVSLGVIGAEVAPRN